MNVNRKILITDDGSHTITIPSKNLTYHSIHGAVEESMHVFINAGLQYIFDKKHLLQYESINIFEVGFGAGLNALLSLQFALQYQQKILYDTVELFPLSTEETIQLNYTNFIDEDLKKCFLLMHACEWNQQTEIKSFFNLKKMQTDLLEFNTNEKYDLIYFDAFDPVAQPELWSEKIFRKMFTMLKKDGALVTYSSKGIVRRAMQSAGFIVEKLKGPKGKREIVRAIKIH